MSVVPDSSLRADLLFPPEPNYCVEGTTVSSLREQLEAADPLATHLTDDFWDAVSAGLAAARADEREKIKAELRQIHWLTMGSDADGTLSGKPVCGECAWLDNIRKPWPCASLRAVGFTEADIPADFHPFGRSAGVEPKEQQT